LVADLRQAAYFRASGSRFPRLGTYTHFQDNINLSRYSMNTSTGSSAGAAHANKTKTAYLVACVGKKTTKPALARDLYRSEWFLRARGYVEAHKGPWFILSAHYGLIASDARVAPYEVTLNTMPIAARRAWAERVIGQLQAQLPPCKSIVVLAGQRYREFLMDYLSSRAEVKVPLQGLSIGRQLKALGPFGHGRI
jgi:hypothetical protein